MVESSTMGKYQNGDHVKFEVVDERSGESEWLWLSVQRSHDESGIVFGRMDSQPIVMTDNSVRNSPSATTRSETIVGSRSKKTSNLLCELGRLLRPALPNGEQPPVPSLMPPGSFCPATCSYHACRSRILSSMLV
jgi:hypothetical protein